MIALVGSKNPVKVGAVRSVLATYPDYSHMPVTGLDVPSGVARQPIGLDTTVKGAMGRAMRCLECDPSALVFGVESGVFRLASVCPDFPVEFEHPMLDVCACVVAVNGLLSGVIHVRVGLSSAWGLSPAMHEVMVARGLTMNQAARATGLTKDPEIGSGQGAIGLLSGGRLDRESYTRQAVLAAMIGWESR